MTKVKRKPAVKEEIKNCGVCVYLGPTIVGYIQHGAIYRGDRKTVLALPQVAYAVKQHPLIASLIVGGETVAEDRLKIKKPGSLLYVNYHKLARGIK